MRNNPYGSANASVNKRRAAEVVQQNLDWIINVMNCAHQIARHQVNTLGKVQAEVKVAITAMIASKLNDCRVLLIPASERHNPLGRRAQDTPTTVIQPSFAVTPHTCKSHQELRGFGRALNNRQAAHHDTQNMFESARVPSAQTNERQPRKHGHTFYNHQKSALHRISNASGYKEACKHQKEQETDRLTSSQAYRHRQTGRCPYTCWLQTPKRAQALSHILCPN